MNVQFEIHMFLPAGGAVLSMATTAYGDDISANQAFYHEMTRDGTKKVVCVEQCVCQS